MNVRSTKTGDTTVATTETTTMQDAFEDAAAEQLAGEAEQAPETDAIADSTPSDEVEESATPQQGGILPRLGDLQTQLDIPESPEEKAKRIRETLKDTVLEAQEKVSKISGKLYDAKRERKAAEDLLADYDKLVAGLTDGDDDEQQTAEAEAATGEAAEEAQGEAQEVDPITGEPAEDLTGRAELGTDDQIGSEDPAPMAARGAGVVIALYPGDDEPHVTQVGPQTLYVELVLDYFAAAGIDGDDRSEYVVHGEDDGQDRDLEAVIDPGDYGKRLMVVAVA